MEVDEEFLTLLSQRTHGSEDGEHITCGASTSCTLHAAFNEAVPFPDLLTVHVAGEMGLRSTGWPFSVGEMQWFSHGTMQSLEYLGNSLEHVMKSFTCFQRSVS